MRKNILPLSTQKLQKVLAVQGLGSRREIERWIQEGRLHVNGKVAHLGLRVDSATAKIQFDGKPLTLRSSITDTIDKQVLLYYKPHGEICSEHDPQGRRTVFESLPPLAAQRWIMVGRLDYNTLGLLLFTTDGELSHRLLHPRYEIEREYAVRVQGAVNQAMLDRLKKGVLLDGQKMQFADVQEKPSSGGKNHWYHVIIKEGKRREVRRLWASQGVLVSRLIRIRFGPIVLPLQLRAGQWMQLAPSDIRQLMQAVGL